MLYKHEIVVILKKAKTNQANPSLFQGRPRVLPSSSIGLVSLYSKKAKHSQS